VSGTFGKEEEDRIGQEGRTEDEDQCTEEEDQRTEEEEEEDRIGQEGRAGRLQQQQQQQHSSGEKEEEGEEDISTEVPPAYEWREKKSSVGGCKNAG
jgi:hypothetical protein